jgi:class 3 adenylate cyclase/tetratricopeptide (TPR) repeat protein
VSELARSWLRECPELISRDIVGTVVFADISGFTRLTERLAARGRFGAEEMSDHLDRVLSELLTAAYDHGGWLVKWGGDALLLMFDDPDHARLACAAAAAMQSTMRRVGTLDASVGRVRLKMSIGVHTGTFSFYFVGQRHRELLITGDAADETARLEGAADAGEILISPETAALLPAHCRGEVKAGGVLLVRPPEFSEVRVRRAANRGVAGLIPELVLDHLVSGGGSGEHRQVTIAFLEFSGLSGLRAASGAVGVGHAVQQLVEVTQEACHRNGVSFHETDICADGGKIMLVAGAPRGLEDPAEAMLCTLRQVLETPGQLSLRAGVTAGRAFTGCVGPARRRSYSVKGDVVNLAARIMGKSPTGAIWALPVVAESSRTRFELGDVPRFTVKGKLAPVLVRSVGRALARVDIDDDLPMIGRAREMSILLSALERAGQGRGEHIDLIGAAGIGKTRLLAELRAAADGGTVLAAAAEPYHASSSYALAGPLLLDALGAGHVVTTALPGWLDQWCGVHAPELRSWLPLLGPPLGVPFEETTQTRDLAPEFRAERVQALVLDLLKAAVPGGLLLVVDDMQFADEASAALLRHLSRQLSRQPWLLVLAGRGDSFSPELRPPGSQTILVEPFSTEESLVFVNADTDDSPLAPHVTAAVVARAGGNPLFLRQLAATAHTTADLADLPDTIETVVAARIDRLMPSAREVLRAAAVVGMSMDRGLLLELLDLDPTKPAVLDHLGEYLAADGDELRFRQAVIRDTAYEGLAFRRRATLHGRLADLLAARHRDDQDAVAAVLSLHLFEAGLHEAAVLYRRAIAAASRLPSVGLNVRADLFERLGDVHLRLGEYERADQSYRAAARLLRLDPLAVARIGLKRARSAERRGAYAVTLARLRRVVKTLHGIDSVPADDLRLEMARVTGFTQFRRGRLAAARASCLTVVENADEARTPELVADALAILDLVDMSLGNDVDGARGRRALLLHKRSGDLASQARVHTQIGYRAYLEGRWDDAVAAYEQARELVERLGDLPNVAVASANIAEIRLDQGRLEEAEISLREAVRVWRASMSDNEVAFGRAQLGRVLARQGRFDDADALLSQARDRFFDQGAKADVVDVDAYQAECLLLRGQPAAALELAEATLVAAGRLSDQPLQSSLLNRVIGGAHDALGNAAAGDYAYEQALDAARRRGAAPEVAFTVAAMSERARLAGLAFDPALVAEVVPLQRRLGLVLDLTAAEAVLVELPPQRTTSKLNSDSIITT